MTPFTDADRRALILALTHDERVLGGASLWADVYPLIRAANLAGLDRRGALIYVKRWQAARGAAAWDHAVRTRERLEAGG